MADSNPPTGRTSPFRSVTPFVVVALLYGATALVWVVGGEALPGGRWLAVHLFTLGVLSNLVLGFSQHFGHTVTRAPGEGPIWYGALLNLGVIGILVGLPAQMPWLLAASATIATVAVFLSYRRLRRIRHQAVGARFGWIVRVYERAHGAFVHGAILGALLGVGLLPGPWSATGRLSHLHINILGWGGLTLLATLVFFGPTMLRTRIEPGADETAARALRHGATGLSLGVIALLVSAVGGVPGLALRILAALGLGVFAVATTLVAMPVLAAAGTAPQASPARYPIIATTLWLMAVVWIDALAVGADATGLLDVLGLAALVGVLLQSVMATLTYLAPMFRSGDLGVRQDLEARIGRHAGARTAWFNLGLTALLAGALLHLAGAEGVAVTQFGWAFLLGAVLQLGWSVFRPLPRPDASDAVDPAS